MCIGKKLSPRWRIIMVVQADSAPERIPPFRGIDRSEAVESAVADRTQRDLSGCVPFRLLKGPCGAQFIAAGEVRCHLSQQIHAEIPIVVEKGTVRVVRLPSQQRTDLVLRRREHEQIALSIKLATGRLDQALVNNLTRSKVDCRSRVEVPELWKVGPLVRIKPFDRLWNDEIEIGVALAVGVGAKVNRNAVGKKGHVGPVIGSETPHEVLVGLAGSAGMLDGHESWNEPQHLRRTALRLEQILLVRNVLLRGGRD